MAGILQLRRGLKSTYISEGTNLAEAFFVTENNSLLIGVSGSDVITLAKMSMANQDNSFAEANTGSFWVTGDYTGSQMYLSGDVTASNAWFKNDVRIDGHLIMGDSNPEDVVTILSDFSGSIVPDMDNFGQLIPVATYAIHDFGTDTKRWRNIYLQKDSANDGFLSGSNIDLTGKLKVDGEGRFGTLRVDDLTNTRVLLAGVDGEVEDSPNFTFDGDDLHLTGSYYQSGSGATFEFIGSGAIISSSLTIQPLSVNNGVVFTDIDGTLNNSTQFTWNGQYVGINGGMTASQDISVNNEAYLQSAVIKDLTNNRVVLSGINHEIEDSPNLTFDGVELNIGQDNFTVQQGSGNTQIVGTLDVDAQSTLASVNIEDLTSGSVVLVGANGEIQDSPNLTFNGSLLTVTGDTIITGDLTVTGDTTTLNVSELSVEDKNILIASGALNATAADGAGITIEGANATILYRSSDNSFTLNKQLKVEGNISGSSFGGTTLLSSSNENFNDYSQSVDLRLIESFSTASDHELRIIESFATSSDHELRIIESFATSSDHEIRVDELETTFSSSVDDRLVENFSTGSNHETRVLDLEVTGSDHEGRINQIETTYLNTGSNNFVGDQIITGSLIVSSSSTFTNIGPSILSGSVSISGSIDSVNYIDFNTSSVVEGKPGRLRWNDDDGTLDLTLKSGNVTLQMGQEQVINAYNNTTSSLLQSEYRAVYVSGSMNGYPAVNLADNLSRVASENTIGIVTEDISSASLGYITKDGMVRDIDMSAFNEGDTLYLGGADGILVNEPPLPPALTVIMGYCVSNDATTGSMLVNVRSGFEYPQYAIAFNLSDHTALADTATIIDLDTPAVQSGITLVDNTKFTVSTPGLYEFTAMYQINRAAGSGTATLYFWAKKNGVDVPNSNTNQSITGNTGTAATLLSKNLVIVLEEGDYIEFYWATTDADMVLKYTAAGTSPTRPATPAVKVTATRLS